MYPLVAGSARPLVIRVAGEQAPPMASTPVTLILDAPGGRHVFRWRPGGTSHSGFSLVGDTLRFDGLTSAFTAAHLGSVGDFPLYLCVGPAATTQDAVGKIVFRVEVPPLGTLPTSDS